MQGTFVSKESWKNELLTNVNSLTKQLLHLKNVCMSLNSEILSIPSGEFQEYKSVYSVYEF